MPPYAEDSMKVVVVLAAAAVMASGCEGLTAIVSTGPSPIQGSTATVAVVRVANIDGGLILVGTPVSGALPFHDTTVQYQFVAPRDGTLFVRVTWEASRGSIELRLAGAAFSTWPDMKPPVTGRLDVRAGQSYPIRIVDAAPWDYGEFNLPFVVVTSLE
jgi:hypothetical protein